MTKPGQAGLGLLVWEMEKKVLEMYRMRDLPARRFGCKDSEDVRVDKGSTSLGSCRGRTVR